VIDAGGAGQGVAAGPPSPSPPKKAPRPDALRESESSRQLDKPLEDVLDSLTRACENAEDSVDTMPDFLFVSAPETSSSVDMAPLVSAPTPAPAAPPPPPVSVPQPPACPGPVAPAIPIVPPITANAQQAKRQRTNGTDEQQWMSKNPNGMLPTQLGVGLSAVDPYLMAKAREGAAAYPHPVGDARSMAPMGSSAVLPQTEPLRELRWSIMQQVNSLLDMTDLSQLQALHKSLHAQIVARKMIASIQA